MSKRYRSNYSLWPEQARPRRTIPMTLAVGGFAIGIACAVAAHNVVTDFLRPTAPQEVAEEGALAHVPIYATAAAPAAAPDAETATRGRSRSVAKVTLPSIGTRGPQPSAATDGRGGNANGRAGEALSGEPNAAASAQAVASAPIPTPAPESVAEIKPADEPAAVASEPRKAKAKARVRRTAKKRRSTPSNYAYRNQNNFFGWGGGYGGSQYYARQQYYGRYY
ncbi:MAG: hypothetical protein WBX07_10155 [Rhodoplanes sp.]